MKARRRSVGLGGSIAALLTTGALLLPTAPAQAMPSRGTCNNLVSVYELALANGDWTYAVELYFRYFEIGCGEL